MFWMFSFTISLLAQGFGLLPEAEAKAPFLLIEQNVCKHRSKQHCKGTRSEGQAHHCPATT